MRSAACSISHAHTGHAAYDGIGVPVGSGITYSLMYLYAVGDPIVEAGTVWLDKLHVAVIGFRIKRLG